MSVDTLSQSDLAVLDLLRKSQSLSINELVVALGVTATAVRQRLSRLVAGGLVDRTNVSNGRGRPSFQYLLTDKGRRSVGNNLNDLAIVLWKEVQSISDKATRAAVMSGIVRRLSELYKDQIKGDSLQMRMQSLAEIFSQQEIPLTVESKNGLPVLNIHGCPYPDLADQNHSICDMETKLFSKLFGQTVELEQCHVHGCCTFQQIESATSNEQTEPIL